MLPAWLSAWHLAARKGQKLRTFLVYFHMISFPVCGLCSVTAASSSPWVSRARRDPAPQQQCKNPPECSLGRKPKIELPVQGPALRVKEITAAPSSSRSWFSVSLPGDPSAPGGCSSLVQAPNHPSSHLTLFISNPGFPKAPRHSVLSIMMWEVPGEAPSLGCSFCCLLFFGCSLSSPSPCAGIWHSQKELCTAQPWALKVPSTHEIWLRKQNQPQQTTIPDPFLTTLSPGSLHQNSRAAKPLHRHWNNS